jgi:hypothetical protein
VAKLLCDAVAKGQKAENIGDYQKIITAAFNGFHTLEIEIPRYRLKIQPWLTWDPKNIATSPGWRRAYNNVKHERDKKFRDASQTNVKDALCGLLVLLLYLYKDEQHLQPYPNLLSGGFPEYLVTAPRRKLPGT